MANGQVVLVTKEPLAGGAPMRTVYYVAEEDPSKAEAIIAACMAPNQKNSSVWSASRGSGEGSWIKTRQFQARMIKYRKHPIAGWCPARWRP